MGLFDSREEQDREAGEKLGREEREYRGKHDFSFPINEMAGDFDAVGRGPEFQAARSASREGRAYEHPNRSPNNDSKSSEPESNTCSGGGYSDGSGVVTSSLNIRVGGLLGMLGAVVIGGAICGVIFGILEENMNNNSEQQSEQMNSREYQIRQKYSEIYNRAINQGNRYKSRLQTERQVRENMEKELRR